MSKLTAINCPCWCGQPSRLLRSWCSCCWPWPQQNPAYGIAGNDQPPLLPHRPHRAAQEAEAHQEGFHMRLLCRIGLHRWRMTHPPRDWDMGQYSHFRCVRCGKHETFYSLFSDLTKRWAKEQMKTNATTEAVRQVNAAQTIDNPPPSR